jgi:outer membrane autotransporter protein
MGGNGGAGNYAGGGGIGGAGGSNGGGGGIGGSGNFGGGGFGGTGIGQILSSQNFAAAGSVGDMNGGPNGGGGAGGASSGSSGDSTGNGGSGSPAGAGGGSNGGSAIINSVFAAGGNGGIGGGGGVGNGIDYTGSGGSGGFGGGGGSLGYNGGGSGGFGGGGGSSVYTEGGSGGFGGGGGGPLNIGSLGGNGGFGGGGGATGLGGFGGGSGSPSFSSGGGGGAAMGGGIFIVGGDNGGTLTIENSGSMSGSSLIPGAGGPGARSGLSYGKGIFLTDDGFLTFSPDTIQTYADDIVDQSSVGGGIGGSWGLLLNGSGTLILTGNNTYSGGTEIRNGTMQGNLPQNTPLIVNGGYYALNGSQALSSLSGTGGTVALETSTSMLTINGSINGTFDFGAYNGSITGTGGLIKTGSGTLTLTGNNTYSGGSALNGGTLSISSDTNLGAADGSMSFDGGILETTASLTSPRNITLNTTGGTFQLIGTGNTTTLSGVIEGPGSLTNVNNPVGGTGSLGTGTLVLTGENTYSGGTVLNGGTLVVSSDTNLGAAAGLVSFDGGLLETTATLSSSRNIALNAPGGTFQVDTEGNTTTLSGPITGGGFLTKTGAGALNLTGNNSYSGGTILNEGTIQGFLPQNTPLTVNGSTYTLSASQVLSSLSGASGTVALGDNSLTIGSATSGVFEGSITGTGGLIKTGSGTLTLTGNNTYSGGTVLNGGTLSISSDTNLGAAAGLVSFDGGILETTASLTSTRNITLSPTGGTFQLIGTGNTTTLLGVIAGPGSLTNVNNPVGGTNSLGTGTLVLTGENTYSGGTVLNGGTLVVSSDTNLGAANGALIFNEGTLQSTGFTSSRNITLNENGEFQLLSGTTVANGIISGGGALLKTGLGTLTLTGNNTYIGETFLNEGALSINSDQNLGKGRLTFNGGTLVTQTLRLTHNITLGENGGTFDVNGSSEATTVSSFIQGIGSLIKTGAGVLALEVGGSYSGGTILQEGTLSIGSGTTLGSGTLSLSNSTLQTGESVTIANPMILEASSTGTLRTGTDGGLILEGIISGTGNLAKNGPGTLILGRGTDPYSGITYLNEGTLTINGNVPNSSLISAPGTTLDGTGSIGSASVAGTIAPGNSIGTLTVLNDFTMVPTGIYEAEVNEGGASDRINVGGNAYIDGTLNVMACHCHRQDLKSKSFSILTATNNLTGHFANLISRDRIKYLTQYSRNGIQILTASLQDFTDAFSPGDNSNAEKTATYFDTFADNRDLSPDLRHVINGLDTLLLTENSVAVQNAFNQIQPSQYKELGQISFLQNELVNRTVGSQQQNLRESLWVEKELEAYAGSAALSPQRVASFNTLAKSAKGFKSSSILQTQYHPQRRLGMLALPGSERVGMPANNWIKLGRSSVWVQSYGQIERTKGNHGNAGIRSETGGISLGGDHEVLKNTYLGFLGGMSTTPFHWQQGRGSGRVKSYYGGIYGTWLSQTGFYADGQMIAGGDNYNSHRNIVYPGVNRKARQSHNGGQFSTDLQAGYVWSLKHLTVQPYADATYMFVNEGGFREKGAQSLDFKIKGRMSQFFRGEIGAQVYKTYVLCDALIRPALQLSWVHKRSMGPNSAKVQGHLVSQPSSLVVSGDNRTRNQVAPGLALTVHFAKGLYIIGNVTSQFGGGQKLGDALLRVGYDF